MKELIGLESHSYNNLILSERISLGLDYKQTIFDLFIIAKLIKVYYMHGLNSFFENKIKLDLDKEIQMIYPIIKGRWPDIVIVKKRICQLLHNSVRENDKTISKCKWKNTKSENIAIEGDILARHYWRAWNNLKET